MPVAGTYGINTYDLTTGVKLDFEDAIYLLSPYDVPLQGSVDAAGRSALATDTIMEKQYSWQDEELLVQRSALAASITTTATAITITAGDGLKFSVGDVIQIGNELVRVSSVATDTLTVVRSYAATTAATAVTSAVIVGVGQTLPEGSDPAAARVRDRTQRNNYSQIFGPWKVHVTGTEDAIAKYGLTGSEFDHQVANRFKEMAVTMEQALLYGVAFEDTSNKWRTFGGIQSFITTNSDSTTTDLAAAGGEAAVLAQLQACYDKGGNPDRIVMGSTQKRKISGFNSTAIRYTQDTTIRGQVVDSYDSDFGRQTLLLDRWALSPNLFIFERDQAAICTLRPWQFEMLAKTGDATVGQVVGEKGFKFYRERHAAKFTALT